MSEAARFKKSAKDLREMGESDFVDLLKQVTGLQEQDVKENQLKYYKPVSDKSKTIHFTTSTILGIGGGNGSSKTETSIVEMVMCATGIIPDSLKDDYTDDEIRNKCKGPMKCRIIVKSLKNQQLMVVRKLRWDVWTGLPPQGGSQGHWGWIPKAALFDGSWDKSWAAGLSTLSFHCRDPFTGDIVGTSSIQFMSSDQEALAMAGDDLQMAILDEPSTLAIWRETQARIMRGGGRIFLAMTWPDDPSIPVDWIFDEIYDKAERDDDIDWIELSSYDNPNLDQHSVKKMAGKVSEELRKIRYEGKPMRFSNLIHPEFRDTDTAWCFECHKEVGLIPSTPPLCEECKGFDVAKYNHTPEFETVHNWPTIFLIDPHPRKPHMWSWVQVDPNNDLWQIAEGSLDQEPCDVAEEVTRVEEQYGLFIAARLIDPNMGRTPCGKRRDITWQDEFEQAGLICELADDSGVGRARINERLKPDKDTYAPRLHIHPRCATTIYHMKRYVWDEYRLTAEKAVKQVPKPKYDDYPTLLKYCVNYSPEFRLLTPGGTGIIKTRVYKNRSKR